MWWHPPGHTKDALSCSTTGFVPGVMQGAPCLPADVQTFTCRPHTICPALPMRNGRLTDSGYRAVVAALTQDALDQTGGFHQRGAG